MGAPMVTGKGSSAIHLPGSWELVPIWVLSISPSNRVAMSQWAELQWWAMSCWDWRDRLFAYHQGDRGWVDFVMKLRRQGHGGKDCSWWQRVAALVLVLLSLISIALNLDMSRSTHIILCSLPPGCSTGECCKLYSHSDQNLKKYCHAIMILEDAGWSPKLHTMLLLCLKLLWI